MFKVAVVVDKKNSAIDRLAKGIQPYMNGIEFEILDVHPKRPDPEQLYKFETFAKTADVIDYQYFRTAEMLRDRYEWLKDIPSILTHHNPYSTKESDWNGYQRVIANNKTIMNDLLSITSSRVEFIPNTVDPYFWKFNEEYKPNRSALMVANRIESKKGILPVAKACKEIGAKLMLVGNISDMDYFQEVMKQGSVEFGQNISDEELREQYYKAGVHVCNSIDNFESGTLPMLEAIYCGLPVITRRIGQVPDIDQGDNLVIQDSDPEDVSKIADLLTQTFANPNLDKLRHDAWFSVKDRNHERRAFMYRRIYRELFEEQSVSVIMPIADRPDVTKKTIDAVFRQDYKNLELIVVDDGEESQQNLIKSLSQYSSIPVMYLKTEGDGYNLAQARNLGIINSTSDIIVFCDQRMSMESNAVTELVRQVKPKVWVYGNKGVKKEFVENFSAIRREDIVKLGMFNERVRKYGGMSQECRGRANAQGYRLDYVETAKATPVGKSNNRWRKKLEILESKNMLWKLGVK